MLYSFEINAKLAQFNESYIRRAILLLFIKTLYNIP